MILRAPISAPSPTSDPSTAMSFCLFKIDHIRFAKARLKTYTAGAVRRASQPMPRSLPPRRHLGIEALADYAARV
jgi:hypothetical protein